MVTDRARIPILLLSLGWVFVALALVSFLTGVGASGLWLAIALSIGFGFVTAGSVQYHGEWRPREVGYVVLAIGFAIFTIPPIRRVFTDGSGHPVMDGIVFGILLVILVGVTFVYAN